MPADVKSAREVIRLAPDEVGPLEIGLGAKPLRVIDSRRRSHGVYWFLAIGERLHVYRIPRPRNRGKRRRELFSTVIDGHGRWFVWDRGGATPYPFHERDLLERLPQAFADGKLRV